MTLLKRLVLLTHPLAHAQFGDAAWAKPFIAVERIVEERWWAAARAMGDDEAIAIVTCDPVGPAAMESCCARATAILGDRCFVLREPDYLRAEFWQFPGGAGDATARGVFDDLRQACIRQGADWNKEEFETSFHTRRCSGALRRMAAERGMAIDPAATRVETWGEVYEGCSLKYSLNFQRMLGLERPVEIDFDMTVPGWRGLIGARRVERTPIDRRTVLDVFETRRGPAALFSAALASPGDRPWAVRLPEALSGVSVVNVRDKALWPKQAKEDRSRWPFGVHEPERMLVHSVDGCVRVPVSTGLVYQLAKAPAYIRAPTGMTTEDFSRHLHAASVL